MKVIEILKVGSKIIEILHNSCIRTNDVKYVPLYDEYEAMVGRGEKKSYVVAYLQGEVGRMLFPAVAAVLCPSSFIR